MAASSPPPAPPGFHPPSFGQRPGLPPPPPFHWNLPIIVPHSGVDDELKHMGIEIDFEDAVRGAEIDLGEMLRSLTNAPDNVGEYCCKECDSDSLVGDD